MGLDIRIENRTGDTPPNRKQRQKTNPPQILLTTPEQIALMLSWPEATSYFAGLRHIIIDELHALYPNKRGDLLALGLARLNTLAPNLVCTGLSATVAEPDSLRRYLARKPSLESGVLGCRGRRCGGAGGYSRYQRTLALGQSQRASCHVGCSGRG